MHTTSSFTSAVKFHLILTVASPRWVPSAVIFVLVALVPLTDPGEAGAVAVGLFFALLFAALTLPTQFGDIDSDGHRELAAAAVGGPVQLFLVRMAAALATGLALSFTATAVWFAVATAAATTLSGRPGVRGSAL